jgi:hypothetical protein
MPKGEIVAIPEVGGLHQRYERRAAWRRGGQMDTLNRSVIVVRPEQPFLDWLHPVDPSSHGITLLDVGREQTIYLIPCDTDEGLEDVLRELREEIFEEQLAGW